MFPLFFLATSHSLSSTHRTRYFYVVFFYKYSECCLYRILYELRGCSSIEYSNSNKSYIFINVIAYVV